MLLFAKRGVFLLQCSIHAVLYILLPLTSLVFAQIAFLVPVNNCLSPLSCLLCLHTKCVTHCPFSFCQLRQELCTYLWSTIRNSTFSLSPTHQLCISNTITVRKDFKTPSHGKCPLGGYPPPPPPGGLRTRFFCKVSEKNLTDKGGTPPPLTDAKSKKFSPQAAFFGVFHPKNTVFDPKS